MELKDIIFAKDPNLYIISANMFGHSSYYCFTDGKWYHEYLTKNLQEKENFGTIKFKVPSYLMI